MRDLGAAGIDQVQEYRVLATRATHVQDIFAMPWQKGCLKSFPKGQYREPGGHLTIEQVLKPTEFYRIPNATDFLQLMIPSDQDKIPIQGQEHQESYKNGPMIYRSDSGRALSGWAYGIFGGKWPVRLRIASAALGGAYDSLTIVR